jgi:general secretion pathway protein D
MTIETYSVRGLAILAAVFAAVFAVEAAAQQSPTLPGDRRPQLDDQPAADRDKREETLESLQPSDKAARPAIKRAKGEAEVAVKEGAASGTPSRVKAPATPFEPLQSRPLKYGDAPVAESSVKLTLTGPMSASEFLDALAVATAWNIASTPAVRQVILEFWTNEITPAQALAVLRFNEVYYEYDKEANFLFVTTKLEHLERAYGSLVQMEFLVRFADMQSVETVLSSLLSSKGRLIADPATSKIVVYDIQDNLDSMTKVMSEIDAIQWTGEFQLIHVDAEAISSSIEALLTESGKLSVDARSNSLVVFDRPQRIERIGEVIAMLDQELATRSWVLDFADPETVAEDVGALVPEAMGSIVVHEDIHQITVTATPYRLNEIDARIKAWDAKRRQVQIEAYLASAGRNILRNLNINWSYSVTKDGDPLDITVGNVGTGSASSRGTTVDFKGSPLGVLINMLNTSDDATILAHPRITVQDGEEAKFENTTEVPFASSTTTFNNNVSGVNSNTAIDFIHVGTVLKVNPRITSGDSILLDIDAEDSTFVSVEVLSNGEKNTLPQKTKNQAKTQVLVRDQETIVLGGLRTSNFSNKNERVPLLGEIPVLGRAFRSTGRDHQDRELLIFLTPTIVGEETQPEAAKLAAFDDGLAETMHLDAMSTLGRLMHKIDKGENEFTVSIGQTGGVRAEGEAVALPELQQLVNGLSKPEKKTMVIREHPRAPKEVGAQVADIAFGRGIKVEYDSRRFPFVPRSVTAPAPEAAPLPPQP